MPFQTLPPFRASHHGQSRRFLIALCFLLVVLWLGATLFLGGDFGFWNDDYFVASVDPVTGERTRWVMDRATPFDPQTGPLLTWRPLYNILQATVSGLSWDAPWIAHGIGAVLHAANAFVLVCILRALGRSWQVIGAAAAIFLTWPVAFETVLWMCAIPTACSVLALLLTLLSCIKWASCSGGDSGRTWGILAVVFATLIPCFNEQPAGALICLPAIYFTVRPQCERVSISIRRLIPLLTGIGAVYLGYIAMVVVTSRGGIGAAGVLTPVRKLVGEFSRIVHDFVAVLGLRFVGTGAMRTGIDAMVHYPVRSIVLLGALAAGGTWVMVLLWRLHARAVATVPLSNARENDGWLLRRGAEVLCTILMAVGSLLPLTMAMGTAVRPRMASVSVIASVILLAGGADWVGASITRHSAKKFLRVLCMFGLVVVVGYGLLSMIGVQRAYQLRARLDADVAQQLRSNVPNPPPNAVFLPLAVEDLPTRTGTPWFDTYFVSPFFWSWGYTGFIQHSYARVDIFSGYFAHEPASRSDLWLCADERGVLFSGPMPYEFVKSESPITNAPPRSVWLPWERVIPFVVSETGKVSVVTSLTISREHGLMFGPCDFVVRPAIAETQRAGGVIPEQPWRIVVPPIDRYEKRR